ncbi:hypothetical protein LX32DRAFT_379478 [Colletotrichum zoysiae]|uniref:Uncharacterized protein n=1 Tax=Colletotrichum zoysiae TaxID=1216348 RepID=A0AAD9M594_9PEZI|nr:hypothetical protein LX32DRAFT_379478 [Colletotrichum zoysiae]
MPSCPRLPIEHAPPGGDAPSRVTSGAQRQKPLGNHRQKATLQLLVPAGRCSESVFRRGGGVSTALACAISYRPGRRSPSRNAPFRASGRETGVAKAPPSTGGLPSPPSRKASLSSRRGGSRLFVIRYQSLFL